MNLHGSSSCCNRARRKRRLRFPAVTDTTMGLPSFSLSSKRGTGSAAALRGVSQTDHSDALGVMSTCDPSLPPE